MICNKIIDSQKAQKCPECQGILIQNAHEIVCEQCGLIIDDLTFYFSYQFNENKNSDMNGADQYISLGKTVDNVCTLGSYIDHYNSKFFFDYKRHILSSKQQKIFKKLNNFYTLPIRIKDHETDYRILKVLNNVTQYLSLSNQVKTRAAYFYQKIKSNTTKIRNHVSLIGFCLFYASREYKTNAPLSIREICHVFNVMGHRISPKLIIRDSIDYQHCIKEKNIPHRSEDFISRFINAIVSSPEINKRMKIKRNLWTLEEFRVKLTQKSEQILHKLDLKIRGARNPFILAAAIVYCAEKLLAIEYNTKSVITQKSAAKAMEIAEYSIRDHFVKVLKPVFF